MYLVTETYEQHKARMARKMATLKAAAEIAKAKR